MEILSPALTSARLRDAVDELCARDAALARVVALHGRPPLWRRPRGFATLVRIILEQQVSLKSAATLFARVERALGAMTPEQVIAQGADGLRAHGLTRQKAVYVEALALHVQDGRLPLHALHHHADAEAAVLLQRVPGIGPWSANIYQLMVLCRPDVWPPGDLALHKALQRMHGLAEPPDNATAVRMAEQWRPLRAVAARILWQGYLAEQRAR